MSKPDEFPKKVDESIIIRPLESFQSSENKIQELRDYKFFQLKRGQTDEEIMLRRS